MTSEQVKKRALELGFDLCGIAPVGAFPELAALRRWLDRGYAGTMAYLPRTAERRADVRRIMPNASCVIVTGTIYNTGGPASIEERNPERVHVARYARADDYHNVLAERLESLTAWMHAQTSTPFEARVYVDTGPVQERVYARYAGLGWIGKNTCVINPELGSWMLLGEIICSLPLDPDAPAVDQCGTCTQCLDACPTGAFPEAGVLDATKCISYLTIEYRAPFTREQEAAVGSHLFGCDICQEVCPWNSMPAHANTAWPDRPELHNLRVSDIVTLEDEALDALITGSPLSRAGVRGLRRNAAARGTAEGARTS